MAKKNKTVNSLAGWKDIFDAQNEQLIESVDKIVKSRQEHLSNVESAVTLFHKLWGESHDSPDYKKDNWNKMQELLRKLGIPA